jgi:carboxylesterase type B
MQQTQPDPDYLTTSDTEALNLNIWVPKGQDGQPLQNLPVYVFIHGGGFISGSGNSPHYDLTRLVRLSTEKRTPIIGVTFKYVERFNSYIGSHGLTRISQLQVGPAWPVYFSRAAGCWFQSEQSAT